MSKMSKQEFPYKETIAPNNVNNILYAKDEKYFSDISVTRKIF